MAYFKKPGLSVSANLSIPQEMLLLGLTFFLGVGSTLMFTAYQQQHQSVNQRVEQNCQQAVNQPSVGSKTK